MLKPALLVLCIAVIVAVGAVAQESKSSISLNLTGVFGKTSTSNGLDQSQTRSAGMLANFRHMLTTHNGFEVNYGYTRNSQNYLSSTTDFGIKAGVHEMTAAYVFTAPRGKVTPFALAGGGGLVFHPTSGSSTGAATQAKATFLYGGGLDYNLSKLLAFRLQYRGLVHGAPDFGLLRTTTGTTHTAEPSVGFVVRF